MIHCVVSSRWVDEGCTGDHASLVTASMCWVRFNSWLVYDCPVLKQACSLIRRCSTTGAILFRIIRKVYVCTYVTCINCTNVSS